MSYAATTEVSVEKTRAEIESILAKYGAAKFAYMTDSDRAVVGFVAHGKAVKFHLPLPLRTDRSYTHTRHTNKWHQQPLSKEDAYKRWEQGCRSRWRALFLCVKAKLEAVECGITTFEQEFLAHFVMPNGQTFGEYAIPQIEEASRSGKMPALLLQ